MFQRGHAGRRLARPPRRVRSSRTKSAPISRKHSNNPVRRGLTPTPSIMTSEPGTISAAISGNAADEESPGTAIGAAASSGHPSRVMRFPPPSTGSVMTVAPKWLEHAFGMVAGWLRFYHRGRPRGIEPGKQYRGFDLCRGHRKAIADRDRVCRPADRQRQASAFARNKARADIGSAARRCGPSAVGATRHRR